MKCQIVTKVLKGGGICDTARALSFGAGKVVRKRKKNK
jgi:hypothetical protein